MCHDIIKYPLNEIIRELKIINQNISTHRIFHTPHFPHSAFSTLRNPHNLSMRALAKILRAQASEHSSNFCEQFEQRPDFANAFKFDVTIRYCSLSPGPEYTDLKRRCEKHSKAVSSKPSTSRSSKKEFQRKNKFHFPER